MMEQTIQQIRNYMAHRLSWLLTQAEHPQKAILSNLRRGVGHIPGDQPELWGVFLQDFPPELESQNGIPTQAEWAIYLALTFYALHQQGHGLPENNMHQKDVRFGRAVRSLVKLGEQPEDCSVLHRFNALATAGSMPECAQHLRGIIQLLRTGGIPLDYVQLAEDLYWLQNPVTAQRVRLRWGQDYYYTPKAAEIEQPHKTEKEHSNGTETSLY